MIPSGQTNAFPATRWSVVVLAGTAAPDAREALASLCRDYWKPLYHFARRRGQDPEDAQDATQGFILSLLESNAISAADQNRGKFRTYLLGAFCNYLAKVHRAQSARKRGGQVAFVDLATAEMEAGAESMLRDKRTPEVEFDHAWALATLNGVMARLRDEYASAGRLVLFDTLQPFLSGGARPGYAELGATTGLSENAVTVAMHRMRKRFGELLRETIAGTVATPEEVDAELRHFIQIVSGEVGLG